MPPPAKHQESAVRYGDADKFIEDAILGGFRGGASHSNEDSATRIESVGHGIAYLHPSAAGATQPRTAVPALSRASLIRAWVC